MIFYDFGEKWMDVTIKPIRNNLDEILILDLKTSDILKVIGPKPSLRPQSL